MKTEKSKQADESATEQLRVQKQPLKRATVYGSSLLRSLQTPERQQLVVKSRQLKVEKKCVQQKHQAHRIQEKTQTLFKGGQSRSPAQQNLTSHAKGLV